MAFTHPAYDRGIEPDAGLGMVSWALVVRTEGMAVGEVERFPERLPVVDAIEPEEVAVPPEAAVADQVPGVVDVDQADRLDLALCRRRSPPVVPEANDPSVPDSPPQRGQGRIVPPGAVVDEQHLALIPGEDGLPLGGQHPGGFAEGVGGGAVQLRVYAVADEGPAERKRCHLVGREADRRQEVAVEQAVALAGQGGDRHAPLRQAPARRGRWCGR